MIISLFNVMQITHIKRTKWCSKKYLTELQGMLLARELEITGDKNEHPAGGARGLAINGGDVMLTLLKRQSRELRHDVLGSHDFLALESQHRSILIEVREPGPIGIERWVVMLHESLCHCVWIHPDGGFWFSGASFCVPRSALLFSHTSESPAYSPMIYEFWGLIE